MIAALLLAAAAASSGLQWPVRVGTVVRVEPGNRVRGWDLESVTSTRDGASTNARPDCCRSVLSRDRTYLLTIDEPAGRSRGGAVRARRVVVVNRVDAMPGEERAGCALPGADPVLSLRNIENGTVRSFTVEGGAYRERAWRVAEGRCQDEG